MSRLTITNVISGEQIFSRTAALSEEVIETKKEQKRSSVNARKPLLDKMTEIDLQQQGPEPALLLGRWLNTDKVTKGFCEIEFLDDQHQVNMRAFGLDENGAKVELATVPVDIFSDHESSETGKSTFSANFEFPVIKASLYGWVKQGVLEISVFNVYKNSDNGRNYFCREFFYAD